MDNHDPMQDKLQSLAFLGAQFAETTHELRNLWMILDTSILLLRKKLQHYPEALHATETQLARVEQQLVLGQRLIEDTLDIARNRPIECTKILLTEWISQTLSWIQFPSDVALTTKIAEREISIDAQKMRQVLINLIHNAIDALDSYPIEHKAIHINAHIEEKESLPFLRLIVSNNGPSVNPSFTSHLFEPFLSTKKDGTGLGLTLCKRIVEAHRGSITARALEDSGMEFEIYIPLQEINPLIHEKDAL